jgi:hypothetical protein
MGYLYIIVQFIVDFLSIIENTAHIFHIPQFD